MMERGVRLESSAKRRFGGAESEGMSDGPARASAVGPSHSRNQRVEASTILGMVRDIILWNAVCVVETARSDVLVTGSASEWPSFQV